MVESLTIDPQKSREVRDLLKEMDLEAQKVLQTYGLIDKNLISQSESMRNTLKIQYDRGKLNEAEYNNASKILAIAEKLAAAEKTRADRLASISKGFEGANKVLSPLGGGLTSISKGAESITKMFTGGSVLGGFGAILELVMSINKEFVEMNKNALKVAGSLGTLATQPGGLGTLETQYRQATMSLTLKYGKEQTQQMLGAGAAIGVAPTGALNLEYIQYVGAAAKILGTSFDAAASTIADISVKTGQGLEYSAVVFSQVGKDFTDVSSKVRESFGDYLDQVMAIYNNTRLYGVSLAEATDVTKTFAVELRTGTLSAANLSKVLTLGGVAPEQSLTAIGWLSALGMKIPGTATAGGQTTQVSTMNPLAQSMAIFTDPKLQASMIQQLMGAGQKFGSQMGYGGTEGNLMGQYFQRMFMQQVFGVTLGSAEWQTFQKSVIPALSKGVPIDTAMANAGIQDQAQLMQTFVTSWQGWSSDTLTFEDRIQSFLQMIVIGIGFIPRILTGIASAVATMFPQIEAAMYDAFTQQADDIVKGMNEAKAAGTLTSASYASVQSSFDILTKAFPQVGDIAAAAFAYGQAIKYAAPAPARASMAIGGTIPETGEYLMHAGETVISPYAGATNPAVSATVNVTRLDDASINMIAEVTKQKVIDELRRKQLYEPSFGV